MNLPNKLTVLRVFMIPLFLYFILLSPLKENYNYFAILVFVIASFTDFLDGYIARKNNLVTNFGKFMDPLADKLLVSSALISLTALGELNVLVVIVILSREFIITGFRTVAADAGIVISASKWGKAKTVSQMIMIPYIMLFLEGPTFSIIEVNLVLLATLLTIYSGYDYIRLNKDVLKA